MQSPNFKFVGCTAFNVELVNPVIQQKFSQSSNPRHVIERDPTAVDFYQLVGLLDGYDDVTLAFFSLRARDAACYKPDPAARATLLSQSVSNWLRCVKALTLEPAAHDHRWVGELVYRAFSDAGFNFLLHRNFSVRSRTPLILNEKR